MPKIIVDGVEIEASEDANLLEVLLSNDIDIPYFCWHPAMGSVGACRQCAVIGYANEEDARGRIVMSCMTPVMEGARYSVTAENASSFRDSVIENLMLNHPHDCPVCEEGGECHLQDMTVMVGHRDRRYSGDKTTFRNQYLGPFIGHEMNRCITCYRCVRYYQDYAGGTDLGAFGSRDRVFFGRAEDGVLENEFAGNLVEVCPTGVFTDKTLSKHYTRKWDLQSSPTVCTSCSLGCNTYSSERYGELRRVHNRYHNEVNGYFLCDRGRFGAQHVNSDRRIPQAGIRNADGKYDPVPLADAIEAIRGLLDGVVVGIGSPRASLEANEALRQLVGAENYANGMTDIDRAMSAVILEVLQSGMNTPSMMEVESYDAILVIGEDITNHAPRLALSVRQALRNRGQRMADETGISSWHDAAVRELTQHDLSPLVLLSPMADKLDDVASQAIRLAPEEIVSLTQKIEKALDSSLDNESAPRAQEVAEVLLQAKRPLIISGTSLNSANVLKAAANLARALHAKNADAGIFLCASEANSLGVALIDNDNSTEGLLAADADVVVVLENDLAARFGEDVLGQIKSLVAIDHLDNATVSESQVVLPAATFAESEGTFVNNEGRLQRSLAVFKPAGDISAAYQLLTALGGQELSAGAVQQRCAEQHPVLAAMLNCAPGQDYRVEGSRVARMTHRASGRTAMLADVSVHEPKQPVDTESPLAFTMEGNQQQAPSTLRPYTWSPGWNSNQSIHKFQSEVGGPDKTGVPGVKIFSGQESLTGFEITPEPARNFIGQTHIFGSDPVSNEAAEIATMIPGLYARMNEETSRSIGVGPGDGILAGGLELAVLVDDEVAEQCVIYPILPGTGHLADLNLSDARRIDGFKAPSDPMRPAIITSDRTS